VGTKNNKEKAKKRCWPKVYLKLEWEKQSKKSVTTRTSQSGQEKKKTERALLVQPLVRSRRTERKNPTPHAAASIAGGAASGSRRGRAYKGSEKKLNAIQEGRKLTESAHGKQNERKMLLSGLGQFEEEQVDRNKKEKKSNPTC